MFFVYSEMCGFGWAASLTSSPSETTHFRALLFFESLPQRRVNREALPVHAEDCRDAGGC